MDIIKDAIEKKYYLTEREEIKQQTWEQFHDKCKDKKIFIFGLGEAGSYFISRYHNIIHAEGVIDNDKKKQGFYVGDFIPDAMGTTYQDIIISDLSILRSYAPGEVAVIITSTKFYGNMMKELDEIGITSYYIMLIMEINSKNKKVKTKDIVKSKDDFIKICCNEKINERKIVISIGNYGGHGKYITEQLLKSGADLDIVWIVKDLNIQHENGVRLIYERNWKKYIYEMETAHIWVYDIIIPTYIKKRSGQFYIQVKHWSSITLKKFFLDDLSTTNTEKIIEQVKYNGKMMDYIFTGSEFDKETCRSGFGFQGECVSIGSARTDALFRRENKEKVYCEYHINSRMHCALYAPTFRLIKAENKKYYNAELNSGELRKALTRRFGGDWFILFRVHPSLMKEYDNIRKEKYVINVSEYDDSQELVAASDIVISDYSSIMFEPAFVHKPVFLFAPDREQYINGERDLLIDYDTLPFSVAETNEELKKDIECFDQSEYEKQVDIFLERYGIHEDGHASERASKFILELLGENHSMNMKKVSVLIPTLNSIEYIQECLESVLHQTLKEIEIIVIDAGSTDGTIELINRYSKEDRRIRLIHSGKKSYGYQLNMGIKQAKGDYIGVVESDDAISSNMYSSLLKTAEKTDADYVKSGFYHYVRTKDGHEILVPENNVSAKVIGKVLKPADYKNLYLDDFYLWRGIYKRDFIIKNGIVFHETAGAAYQDIGFLYQVFTLSQKAVYLDGYYYRYRRNNIGSSTYSDKAISFLAEEYCYVLKCYAEKSDKEWLDFFYRKLFIQCRSRIRLLAYHLRNIDPNQKPLLYLQGLLKEAFANKEVKLSAWDTFLQMEFLMFIENISDYVQYCQFQISDKEAFINFMAGELKKHREIVLVSNSKVLPFVYALIKDRGINNIVKICDNDQTQWGTQKMGLEIVSVEKGCIDSQDKAFIIANPRAKKELLMQLNSYGVKNEQIFIYDLGCEWIFLS